MIKEVYLVRDHNGDVVFVTLDETRAYTEQEKIGDSAAVQHFELDVLRPYTNYGTYDLDDLDAIDDDEVISAPTTLPARGIAKMVPVSSDLLEFMQLPPGSKTSRVAAVKFLSEYTKEHNLKDRQYIKLDETLHRLLGIGHEEQQMTFFKMCEKLVPHFTPNTV